MRLSLIIALTILSPLANADTKGLRKVMDQYLNGFKTKDAKALEKITTPNYMKLLKANGVLQKAFKGQRETASNNGYDLKFKKASVTKGRFFVNIKDKSQPHYSEYWYIVQRQKNGTYLIEGMHMMEE